MSKRMRYFFLNTTINAYISHTLDVLNFQSDANGFKTAKEKLNLLKQLFTKKSYSTIVTGLNVAYLSFLSNGILSSTLNPIITNHYVRKIRKSDSGFLSRLTSSTMSSMVFSTIAGSIVHPLDYIRFKYMGSKNIIKIGEKRIQYKNVRDLIDKTYIAQGFGEFFTGIKFTLAKTAIGGLIHGSTFEVMKNILGKKDRTLKAWERFVCGTIAFSAMWAAILPIEKMRIAFITDKARENAKFKNDIDCIRKIYNEKGLYGLYGGLSIVLVKGAGMNLISAILYKKYKTK